MAKINVLDKSVAELIAAGEVVERPASVVKELVENCIDAGATEISVEIKGGGIGYIRITDNGCGIDKEDLPKAFLRHATSKVLLQDDLLSIASLGFRGEALASVSAVSKIEMRTKTSGGEGVKICVNGGEIGECEPFGCPDGTTVIVRDIFYNTPARMKFLRKDISEGNAVAQIIEKIALSHPEIAFKFVRDNQIKLKTSGSGELLAAIALVLGRDIAAEMLPVNYSYNHGFKVSGYIGKPSCAKASRAYQYFYINSRYVRTKTASAAIEEAFKGRLMTGKFPVCVLNIEIPYGEVDVNVHPAKTEVRFSNDKPVFQSVYYAAKTALTECISALEPKNQPYINPITINLSNEAPVQQTFATQEKRETPPKAEPPSLFVEEDGYKKQYSFASSSSWDISVEDKNSAYTQINTPKPMASAIFDKFRLEINDTIKTEPQESFMPQITTKTPEKITDPSVPEIRLIGELFTTYILLQQGDDFLMVDKHAAHEGMLYKKIKADACQGNRQILLEPTIVKMPLDEYDILIENFDKIEALGIYAEDFGERTLIVREVPATLYAEDISSLLSEIAQKITSGNNDLTPSALDSLYFSIACKSAVRAGDKSSNQELLQIINMLKENPEITHCPHGRPIVIRLSKAKIEKMFGRLGA